MEILRGIRNRFQEHRLELLAGRRTAIIALSSIPLHQHTASQKRAAEIPRGIRNRFREQPLVALQAATLLWSILLRLHTALPAQAVETLPGILNCFREHPLELLRNEMWRGMGARLFFTKKPNSANAHILFGSLYLHSSKARDVFSIKELFNTQVFYAHISFING